MTAYTLQTEIIERLGDILQDVRLPSMKRGDNSKFEIYRQDLPSPRYSDEDEDEDMDATAPYIIVRMESGRISEWREGQEIDVILIVCVYDKIPELPDTPNKQGATEFLLVFDKIHRGFCEKPSIGNFQLKAPIEWAIQTDVDTFPFYLGAIQLTYTGPYIEIIDELA